MAFEGTRYKLAYGILAVAILGMVVFLAMNAKPATAPSGPSATSTAQTIQATFACDANKTIDATFTNNTGASSTVSLKLSDGRTMTLPQTISADGARYANADETFVFWNKGTTSFVEEGNTNVNNPPMTYQGCIALSPDPSGTLTKWYSDSKNGFSIRYPEGYVVDSKYQYQELGPGKAIDGVKFTISKSIAAGTNLSNDSYLSVEKVSLGQPGCSADIFLPSIVELSPVITDENGTQYSIASTTDAAAGNRYEERVYALVGTDCYAIRYFIHYGVIDNYPPGTVKEFDKAALLAQFDAIRRTLVIAQ